MMNNLLDVARGTYARLSPRTRARLGSVVQWLPESFKWGGTYREWRQRLTTSDADAIKKFQTQAITRLLAAAFTNSPYYREILTDVFGSEFRPDVALNPDRWTRIPILTSAIVAENPQRLCTVAPSRLDVASTGGSSGQPLKFYLDRNRSPIEYAFVHHAWARAGYRAGDARCVFRGVELSEGKLPHMQYDAGLRELRCSVFHMSDQQMARYYGEIRARRLRFVHGYPSAIAIFAAYLQRAGLAPLEQIQGVFLTSERYYPAQRPAVSQAFAAATIVPFYGLSEKVAFATASPTDDDVFSFEPLYGLTELVDEDGRPVTAPGATGRLVSTGLLFPGMPFLRYDTGDTAELVALPSAENSYRLMVRDILPKHGSEFFVGRSGALIGVKGIISNLKGTAHHIREYQFYQDVPGEVTIRIVPVPNAVDSFEGYPDLLNKKAVGELNFTAQVVERLPVSVRGKRAFIEQRLDLQGR
jgi:phenylacetate-coenzyme A ligase PaaK-like adenylate-forming protein